MLNTYMCTSINWVNLEHYYYFCAEFFRRSMVNVGHSQLHKGVQIYS